MTVYIDALIFELLGIATKFVLRHIYIFRILIKNKKEEKFFSGKEKGVG